jgi:hypothetical protein
MNTKLIVALVAFGVLAVALLGAVSAQLVTTQTPTQSPDSVQNIGFWRWIGRCFGFIDEHHFGAQEPLQANITVTDPNTGQTSTYQSYFGYGYGGCMRGYYP